MVIQKRAASESPYGIEDHAKDIKEVYSYPEKE